MLKSFARKTAATTLLMIAWVLENFWLFIGLAGMISISYGVHLIYRPAGWIVAGLFALREAEAQPITPPQPTGGE